MAITFAFHQIDGICFVCEHSLSMSRSQDLALLPRCCSISVSRSSKQAAFPGFNRLRPVASSSRLKGLVSSVGGWVLLGTIVLWCSPGGHRSSTLLQLDNSWLAIWSAVPVVTTGGETLLIGLYAHYQIKQFYKSQHTMQWFNSTKKLFNI